MRKNILLLIIFILPFVANAYTGSSGMSYQECKAFSDNFKNISGSYEYKSCYRAACSSNGNWTLANMGTSVGYSCANGNPEPRVEISDGCSQFSGSCTLNSGVYCTTVRKINCNQTKDGKTYSSSSTPTQTKTKTAAPVTSTKKPTKTTAKTSRKTSGSNTGTIITVSPWYTTGVTTRTVAPTTEEVLSNNNNIKRITINDEEQNYNPNFGEYDLPLPYGELNINVWVETEDDKATVSIIGDKNMPDEDTDILITVKAQDGSERNVIFHVKRYHGLSKDCTLKYIRVNNVDLKNYDKNNFRYTLKINKNMNELDLDVSPNDTLHSTYEIIGNSELKNKSVVTISVTAENGDVCAYNIVVKKPSGIWIPIIVIIIVTGILIAVGYYVYGYFKRSKDMYKYE